MYVKGGGGGIKKTMHVIMYWVQWNYLQDSKTSIKSDVCKQRFDIWEISFMFKKIHQRKNSTWRNFYPKIYLGLGLPLSVFVICYLNTKIKKNKYTFRNMNLLSLFLFFYIIQLFELPKNWSYYSVLFLSFILYTWTPITLH